MTSWTSVIDLVVSRPAAVAGPAVSDWELLGSDTASRFAVHLRLLAQPPSTLCHFEVDANHRLPPRLSRTGRRCSPRYAARTGWRRSSGCRRSPPADPAGRRRTG